jgi:hypothetical protein
MPIVLNRSGMLRVYYSARTEDNRSYGAFVDLDADTLNVIWEHPDPVISPGRPGLFDDAGAMPSCIVTLDSVVYLYYVGWSRGVSVPFRQGIGMAASMDRGETFSQPTGPVLDRSQKDPYSVSMPFILREDDRWRMWYCSYRGWVDGESRYDIRYAQGTGCITWKPWGVRCMSHRWASARPCVLRRGDGYEMWFCHRGLQGFRTNPETAYRIGYARSKDGLDWELVDADVLKGHGDWDGVMQCYPYVYEWQNRLHMLYCGDGFGQTGIGHAIWEDE